jgi:hypothetical protein
MTSPLWQLTGTQAQSLFGQRAFSLDVLRPEHGLILASEFGACGRVLQVHSGGRPASAPDSSAPESVEVYTRGADLVATYAATVERPNRLQIYWRLEPNMSPGLLAACELIVSVQTPLLASDPRIHVASTIEGVIRAEQQRGQVELTLRLPAGETAVAAELARVARDASTEAESAMVPHGVGTYIEIVHPRDSCGMEIAWQTAATTSQTSPPLGALRKAADCVHTRHELFTTPLEKGVILRSRIWSGWFSATASRAELEACRARFLHSEPVLTT